MSDHRIVELTLAALIQYSGASVRRRYGQTLLLLAALSPGLRAKLDGWVGKDAGAAQVIGDAASGILERVSDLAIALVSWMVTAYQAAWAAFGLLAEAALGTVASLIREGIRFDLTKHTDEFNRKWNAFKDDLNKAFDTQYTWTMSRVVDEVQLNHYRVDGISSTGPVVTFSFCAQSLPYRDSGRRIDFRLRDGILEWRERNGNALGDTGLSAWSPLTDTLSFHEGRAAKAMPGLRFEMLAASNDRVFVKVRDYADFYFAIPAEMFKGSDRETGIFVPSLYFKLDPSPEQRESADLVAQISDSTGELRTFSRSHPQAERLPLLHAAIGKGVMPAMLVSVKPMTLYRLDTRPPRLGIGEPPSLLKTDESPRKALKKRLANQFVGYQLPGVGTFAPPKVIDRHEPLFDLVLSIGVGNFHFYESWSEDHGGEIQWLRKIGWQNLPINSALYGTFNGPIADGDGAIDGTCNFYLLVRLQREDGTSRFGILWCDEQTFFTKRWRLVDPRDIEPWALNLPNDVNLSVHAMLRNDRAKSLVGQQYDFSEKKFLKSDPFENGWIDESSRMAVARQVLLVTGRKEGRPQLFSINYSYGSVDRLWRSRPLPKGGKRAKGASNDLGLRLDSIHLREDMTISIAGRASGDADAPAGRWFQRYLPCHRRHPEAEFSHPWRFMTQATWDRVAQFSHFGVLSDVDSRAQYYSVQLVAVNEEDVPTALQLNALDGALVEDRLDQLFIRARKFKWGAFNELAKVETYLRDELPDKIGKDSEIESLLSTLFFDWHAKVDSGVEYRRSRSSMFNANARFRLLDRGILGWMLVWDDKRDDDLVSLSDLPLEVELSAITSGRVHQQSTDLPPAAVGSLVGSSAISKGGIRLVEKVRVRLLRNVRVSSPPCVELVRIESIEGTDCWARLSFETPLTLPEALFSLWKCHIAYFPVGASVPIRLSADGLLVESCDREALASGGMRFTVCMPLLPPAGRPRIFTRDDAETQGLCIWFENAIGQVSTPDELLFA